MAKVLNISPSTVSRALADSPKISSKTKKKVIDLAKELNYLPDLVAQSLKSNKTRTIGFIIPDISNPICPEIAKGAEDLANENKLNVILCNSDYNPIKELEYLKILIQKRVDGILVVPYADEKYLNKIIYGQDIPVVLLDSKPMANSQRSHVYTDHELGAYLAAKYLIDSDHRRIAIVNGPKVHSPCEQMERGYKKALKEAGIPLNNNYIKKCNFKKESGYSAMRALLSLGPEKWPTGILFISDMTAIGAYDAIYENSYRIPQNFSIIGYDNILEAKYFNPPLTTVNQDRYELGKIGMKLLIDELRSTGSFKKKIIKLKPRLVIRGSSGSPRTVS
ncbi:MAG: LacI family DNA-binding transcriptional regulator [Actinomycetota bacterium]